MDRKKAIVTGASRGIGKGIALCLAEAGYDLAISYYSKEQEAIDLKTEIENRYGTECYVFCARLEEKGAGIKLFQDAVECLGGLDLLVNNAGVTIMEHILDMKEETLDFLIALDFKNYLLMTREAVRYMVKRGIRGSVINITSSRGERAYPADAVYGGLKAGLNRAIQSIALDVAPYGIRINNVAPGAICIRTKEEIKEDEVLREQVSLDFWELLGSRIPMGRSGTPADIGHAVAFLASEQASYITGITLRVDGGLILPGMPENTGGSSAQENGECDTAESSWGYVKPEFQ